MNEGYMDNSIGDILNGEPTDETPVVEEVVETPEAETEAEPEKEERPRGPDGKFIPKTGVEPQEAETVPPTTDRLPQAEFAALKDERRKRQELEARLAELETYLHSQKPKEPAAPPPDMFDDPEGFKAHLRAEILQELQPSLQGAGVVTHARLCERLARQTHEDYDATVELFKEELGKNPYLLTELQQADDPAMYAYNVGKQVQQARSYGNAPLPSREQIEAELREQIMAEINLNRPKAPSTFAGDRSVGSRSGPAWTGPAPLGDLLR